MADDRDQSIQGWREDWIAHQTQHSQHAVAFWSAVATRLLADRELLPTDPLIPVGHYALDQPHAFAMLIERNQEGLAQEQDGHLDEAVLLYEVGVADCFTGSSPYERLRSIYTTRVWYADALRVCEAYLLQPERSLLGNDEYFRNYAYRLSQRLKRQADEPRSILPLIQPSDALAVDHAQREKREQLTRARNVVVEVTALGLIRSLIYQYRTSGGQLVSEETKSVTEAKELIAFFVQNGITIKVHLVG